ncbi:hypothetical protein D3Z45_08250 [Lachnospiraceae bacterium]|nr:hypothetical protein [Lachnospiraceae bacterium]
MNMEKGTWKTEEGDFGYRVEAETGGNEQRWITVTDYRGTQPQVHVPARIEGIAVRAVAKKAFLSRKNLRKAVLSEELEEVGDWAFAYCSNLESVWLPKKRLKLGNRVFMECPGIRRIYTYEMTRLNIENFQSQAMEQTAALLAAAAVMLDAEYLLDVQEAGTKAWIQKWDARMAAVMAAEDGEGYTKMILCGEEDYGCSLEEFIRNKRKGKVRLALLRLLNPLGLEEEDAALWKEYLLAHTKGCETEETWEVLLEEHGYEENYFRLFAEIGALREDNFDSILKDMAEGYAEMKAYFISYRQKNMEGMDFFDGLSLDDI